MNKSKVGYVVIGLICGLMFNSVVSMSASSLAGSESDPIVTKSYVEKKIIELEKRMNDVNQAALLSTNSALEAKLESIKNTTLTQSSPTSEFVLSQVKKGDFIAVSDGGLFIMRAGTAVAVASSSGGLSDLTTGENLLSDHAVKSNHLILVSKNDGRGIRMTYDGWIMVKGTFKIQTNQ